ncbi:MAG TPA: type II secretion system protein [Usitatibacter sp.]|nr:type II secretion system protein [Usitatibacter sp.]
MRSSPGRSGAFTLIEIAVAILILTILASGIAMPVAAQLQLRRAEETRRLLDDARESLLGFAAANGRLPCPATETSRGEESFAPGGDGTNGNCARFHDAYLPAATLGLAPLDGEGFARDAWNTEGSRIRYAVFGAGSAVNGIVNPFTRVNGLQAATLAALGDAPHFIFICASNTGASGSGCGPAANQLTKRAAFVLLSLGPNAGTAPAPGSDEARNQSGDPVFVYHEATGTGNGAYDDVIQWVPMHLVASRMLAAGRLP